MKRLSVLLPLLLMAALSMSAWAAEQPPQDLGIVTGEHWVPSSLEQKRAFLIGVGNVLEIGQALAGDDYEKLRGISILPVLLEGLSGVGIAEMVEQVDAYYASNPDQVNRPVIEVLYLEMALPKLAS